MSASGDIGRRLASRRWDAERFGLTPTKLWRRIADRSAPSSVLISPPKAGTHLVERVLCLHPRIYRALRRTLYPEDVQGVGAFARILDRQRAGELVLGHVPHSAEREGALRERGRAAVLVVRDPRDMLVSDAFFLARTPKARWHEPVAALATVRERIEWLMEGDPRVGRRSIGGILERYAGWLEGGCLVVRYEDLVAEPEGRRETMARVYAHVGVPLGERAVAELERRVVSSASPTFRRGGVGEWREHFDDELAARFGEVAGAEARRYGYGTSGSVRP